MDDVLARFNELLRRCPPIEGVELADRVTRLISGGWAGVLWSDLDAGSADAVIAREIERFAGLGPWEWKLYSFDEPHDLAGRLRAHGFVSEAEETLLMAALADLTLDDAVPAGVELLAVEDEPGVAALARVHAEAFGRHGPALGRDLLDEIRAGRSGAVVAMAGGRPICGGRIEFYGDTGFAGLFGGGTVPEWRGRGVFHAVVAVRAAMAASRGCRYLQTDASEDSRPIFERLGFARLGTTTPFIHP
jgi:hypothetical protein